MSKKPKSPEAPVQVPVVRAEKPKFVVIKNRLPQVLTLVVGGRGIELPPRGERAFPANTQLGPDVDAKIKRKLIQVCR